MAVAATTMSGCTGDSAASTVPAQPGEKVAPWGDSATQAITAVDLAEGAFFLLRPPPPEAYFSPNAAIRGPLTVLSGGCLGVGASTAVVWPAGTTALPDGNGVQLSDGQVLRVGGFLSAGGGFSNIDFMGRAEACPSSDVAIVNDPVD